MSPGLRRSAFHRLFTDGSSRGNPGPAGAGAALYAPTGTLQATVSAPLLATTNNAAEYLACLHGLHLATALGVRNLLVLSDSRLLVSQVRGHYATRDPRLSTLRKRTVRVADSFDRCAFVHIKRKHNTVADRLAVQASSLPRPAPDKDENTSPNENSTASSLEEKPTVTSSTDPRITVSASPEVLSKCAAAFSRIWAPPPLLISLPGTTG